MLIGLMLVLGAHGRAVASDAALSDPTLLSELQAWYRADLGTDSLNQAGGAWEDQSGNGNDADVDPSYAAPLLISSVAALNHQPVLHFSGAQALDVPVPMLQALTQGEMLVVTKASPTSGLNNGWIGLGTYEQGYYPTSTGQIEDDFGADGVYTVPAPSIDLTTYHLFDVSAASGGLWALRLNDVLQIQGAAEQPLRWASYPPPTIGQTNYQDGAVGFSGDIAEILIFDAVLTDAQRQKVNAYLNGRYLISAAPQAAPVQAQVLALSPSHVDVSWSYAGSDQVQFLLQRSSDGITWTQVAAETPDQHVIDATVVAATVYQYRVAAVTLGGSSSWSVTAAVTTPSAATAFNALIGWYRADIGGSTLTNSQVWPDQSGSGNDAVVNPTWATPIPVSAVAALNQRPVLRFTGTQAVQLPPEMLVNLTQGEMLVVTKANPAPGINNGWIATGGSDLGLYPDASGALEDAFGESNPFIIPAPTVDVSTYHLYDVSAAEDGAFTLHLNDFLQIDTPAGPSLTWSEDPGPIIGQTFIPGLGWTGFNGDIAEVMIFDQTLDDADRLAMGQYLDQRYQIVPAAQVDPAQVVATALSPSQVEVDWTYAGTDRVQFLVQRSTDGTTWVPVGNWHSDLRVIDATASAGTSYQYRVAAFTLAGPSGWSAVASVTTPSAPTLFSSLIGWYSADVGGSQLPATQIWPDQSGLGNDAFVSPYDSAPGYVSEVPGLNGRPTLRFNGSSESLGLPVAMLANQAQAEMVVVAKATPTAGVMNGWIGTGETISGAYPDASGDIADDFGELSPFVIPNPTVDIMTYHLYDVTAAAGGSWVLRLNDQLQLQASAGPALAWAYAPGPVIGRTGYPGYYSYFSGDIAEILVFDQVLTDDQRQQLGLYLNGRYQIAPGPLAAVGPVSVLALSPTHVEIDWSYPGADAVQFAVQRSSDGVTWTEVGGWQTDTSLVDATVSAGMTYRYRVAAFTVSGQSAWSLSAALTTPLATTGFDSLIGWYRADLGGAHIAATGTWPDQSGNGNDAVLDGAAAAPDLVPSITLLNDRPVLRFNGTNQVLNLPSGLMQGLEQAEMVVVAKASPTPSQPNGWITLGQDNWGNYPDGYGEIQDGFGEPLPFVIPSPSVDITSYHLYDVSAAALGQWNLSLNHVQQLQEEAGPTLAWSLNPQIGQTENVVPFSGDIAEIMIFNQQLSAADRTTIESHLQSVYGEVANLRAPLISSTAVYLQWDSTLCGTVAVQRRASPTGLWTTIATVTDASEYIDSSVQSGQSYTYQVALARESGPSAVTNSITIQTGSYAPIPQQTVSLSIGAPKTVEGCQVFTLDGSASIVVGGTAAGYATTQPAAAGARQLVVAGGTGHFDVNDVITIAGQPQAYLIQVIVFNSDGTQTLLISSGAAAPATGLGLGAAIPAGAGILADTDTSCLWEWDPHGAGFEPWGDTRTIVRSMRGTDSDPWAYAGGVFTDAWGRPDGTYPIRFSLSSAVGEIASVQSTITVVTGAAPVANAGGPYTCAVGGVPAFLNATLSSDDYGIVDVWWDADIAVDSTGSGDPTNNHDLYGLTGLMAYSTPGDHICRVHVYDGRGHEATADAVVHVLASAPPRVETVPFEGNPARPHPALAGVGIDLRACAWGSSALSYRWNYGDQYQDAGWTPCTNAMAITANHAYGGDPGTTYTATVTVQDAQGNQAMASLPILVRGDALQAGTDIAIERGLWWLHQNQDHVTLPGSWDPTYVSQTASALQAFCIHGHLPFGDPSVDPYCDDVRNGLRALWTLMETNPDYAATYASGVDTKGQPMNDANGLGIDPANQNYAPYELGMVMDAMAAVQDPLAVSESGPAGINGRRFLDLERDAIDTYAWGQSDQGGWRYQWNADSDNSACQWAAIGCRAAQSNFGLYAPGWVHSENLIWLANSYDGLGSFIYNSISPANAQGAATTPSGLIQLNWDGILTTDPRWQACETHMLQDLWQTSGYLPDPLPDVYSMYDMVKAMRLATPAPVVYMEGSFDWSNDPANGVQIRLQGAQNPDGSWSDNDRLGFSYLPMSTAWCVTMLSPSLFSQQTSHIGLLPPALAAQSLTVPTDPGKPYATVGTAQVDVGSSDPSGLAFSERLQPSGPYPVGQNQVVLTAVDSSGLSSSTMVTITVVDREAPVVTAAAALTLTTDPGQPTASSARVPMANATDNVGVVAITSNLPAALPVGTSTVTWSARDAAGNVGTASERVTVVDREAPVIVPPPAVVLWIGSAMQVPAAQVSLGQARATDNVGVVSLTDPVPASFPIGTTPITWTARDAAGNQATAIQSVVVHAGQPKPTVQITAPGTGTSFLAGSALTVVAEVDYASPGSVQRVDFLIDGVFIGSASQAPYQAQWQGQAGTHAVTATATLAPLPNTTGTTTTTSPARSFQVVSAAQVQAVTP